MATRDYPDPLKPYAFHRMELDWASGRGQAVSDCPFCDKKGKFYINAGNGMWDCKVCGASGNSATFVEQLVEEAEWLTDNAHLKDKALAHFLRETLNSWGVCRSPIDGCWMITGYNESRNVRQLYRYSVIDRETRKRRWLATPGLRHCIHGLELFDDSIGVVFVCEGPRDGMALYQTINQSDKYRDKYNVVALPGCNVFDRRWCDLFAGKVVRFVFDNDHPNKGRTPAALAGIKRTASILKYHINPPKSLEYVRWGSGDDYYEPNLKSGFDTVDWLYADERGLVVAPKKVPGDALRRFVRLRGMSTPVPDTWLEKPESDPLVPTGQYAECTLYKDLVAAWRRALVWSFGLDLGLSTMIAAILSNGTPHDQLWIKVLGPPSCGKSTLCEAVSVNAEHVYAKSSIRGFHSGYQTADGRDTSLIAEANGKTLVTKDGDTLLQAPNRDQILSEGRDVYDKTSRTHYRNTASRDYNDIHINWILCGTSSLQKIDSSELGERFLDCVVVDEMTVEKERKLNRRASSSVFDDLLAANDGEGEANNEALKEAMKKTGGYIDHLMRGDIGKRFAGVENVSEETKERIGMIAQAVARLRARPSTSQEEVVELEISARLTKQLSKLAACLAVVINRPSIDERVMRRVYKVANATARGTTYILIQAMYNRLVDGGGGMSSQQLSTVPGVGLSTAKLHGLLRFLKAIKAVTSRSVRKKGSSKGSVKWFLTDSMREMFEELNRYETEGVKR